MWIVTSTSKIGACALGAVVVILTCSTERVHAELECPVAVWCWSGPHVALANESTNGGQDEPERVLSRHGGTARQHRRVWRAHERSRCHGRSRWQYLSLHW